MNRRASLNLHDAVDVADSLTVQLRTAAKALWHQAGTVTIILVASGVAVVQQVLEGVASKLTSTLLQRGGPDAILYSGNHGSRHHSTSVLN